MTPGKTGRLVYIDWMRGVACLLMFQTHCYDAWLSPEARKGWFYPYSRLTGSLPAPIFLFLAGVSTALLVSKMRERGADSDQIGRKAVRRGAEILGLGLLFRLQEFLVALGWAPWSDLFRVDILNSIGMAMMLVGAMCWIVTALNGGTRALIASAGAATFAIAMLAPLMWTVWRANWLPWQIRSYLDGAHDSGTPQLSLFPIFPWAGFAFAGFALGIILFSEWAREHEGAVIAGASGAGLLFGMAAYWIDLHGPDIYPVYDFWRTSPNFFAIRLGILLAMAGVIYAWCRWGLGKKGFSPLAQMGQTSLLVYWVHIELVYGKFSILPKRAQNIANSTLGLTVIFLAMLGLSILRTRWKGRGRELWQFVRRPLRAQT
jgi:uncharacterized membrane protein